MIHKIQASELQPGMYVVNLFLSPSEYPHVYPKEGLLQSPREIADISGKGFLEAFVDDARSTVPICVSEAWAQLIELSNDAEDGDDAETSLPAAIDVKTGMEKAVSIYTRALGTAEDLFQSLRKGRGVPMEAADATARSVVDGIMCDNQALAAVARLLVHDDYTFAHSVNVSVLAALFGKSLHMPEEQLYCLAIAGLLHDVGKISIPTKLLNTARPLLENELEIMRRHVEAGYETVTHASSLARPARLAVLEHHERHNGTGYPFGRRATEISPMGRILSIVDVYDALTGRRSYRPSLIPYTAVSLLFAQRGQNFDPEMVDRFIQCVGIYPVGSVVKLSTGETGVVYLANARKPLCPVIAVVLAPDGSRRALKMLDLAQSANVSIVSCHDATSQGINCASILRSCTWAMLAPASSPPPEPQPEGLSFSRPASRIR